MSIAKSVFGRICVILSWLSISTDLLANGSVSLEEVALRTTADAVAIFVAEQGHRPNSWDELRNAEPPARDWARMDAQMLQTYGYTLVDRYQFIKDGVPYLHESQDDPPAKLLMVRNIPIKGNNILRRLIVYIRDDGITSARMVDEELLQSLLKGRGIVLTVPSNAPEYESISRPARRLSGDDSNTIWENSAIALILVGALPAMYLLLRTARIMRS